MSNLPPDDLNAMNGWPEGDFPPPPLDWLEAPTGDYADIAFLFDDTWDLSDEALLDDLFNESLDLTGVQLQAAGPTLDQSLAAMGLTRDSDIPLALDSPPLLHADSGTQLWFGVLQPDPADDSRALLGILSAREDEVAFAPVASGDVQTSYAAAAKLIDLAETQGLDMALAQAMTLAVEHQQFDHWQHAWGTPLPQGPQQQVRDFLDDLEI